MAQGTLRVNTENILPIIKKWLYSDKEVFLRELVANACDALSKLKILKAQGEAHFQEEELRMSITLDKAAKTIQILDTGIGMTAEEVEKYIAELAFSGAEEFLSKYKSNNEQDQVIGHFGLGFYSAYMVSSKVDIDTLSYKEESEPAYWSCDGTSSYTLEKGTRAERGTTITLFVEDEEFLELSRLEDILTRYCAFLPFPVYLNEKHLNPLQPLWLKSPSECTDKEYLDFYRKLYPLEPDPIFWIHLNVDYPFHLKGILYFPKVHRRFDFQKNLIKLFCNRVFVSDNCQDLIPDYLSVLRGVLDSPDIPLNVSRSYLQSDSTVRSLSTHISKKVADRLSSLYKSDQEQFLSYWEDIQTIIKLGALQDEKFYEKVKDVLVWKTLKGNWLTLPQYLEKHKETHQNKIFYTQDAEAFFLKAYQEKDIDILLATGPIDLPLMNALELKHSPAKFQRIDGKLDSLILDVTKEKSLLDANGRSESAKIADFVRSALKLDKLEIEAKSLKTEAVHAFIVLHEESRRLRDTLALSQSFGEEGFSSSLAEKKTFVVNTNSPLINAIYQHPNQELAQEVTRHLYQLALLSQKELAPKELPRFIEESNKVLEKLLLQK